MAEERHLARVHRANGTVEDVSFALGVRRLNDAEWRTMRDLRDSAGEVLLLRPGDELRWTTSKPDIL